MATTKSPRNPPARKNQYKSVKDYFKNILNNAYDAIFVHDLSGKVIDVNDRVPELYGVTQEETLSRLIVDHHSASDNNLEELHDRWTKSMSDDHRFLSGRPSGPRAVPCLALKSFLSGCLYRIETFFWPTSGHCATESIEKLLLKEKKVFVSVVKNNPHF